MYYVFTHYIKFLLFFKNLYNAVYKFIKIYTLNTCILSGGFDVSAVQSYGRIGI